MADEFAKGFTILITAGLAWLTLAGWYNTPSFESIQLLGPNPSDPSVYAQIGLVVKEAMLVFAVVGFLTFVVVIPIARKISDARAGTPEVPE